MLLSNLTGNYRPKNQIKAEVNIKKVTSDSRAADENSLFVCISGAKFDGHDFARSAYEKGCRNFAVEREIELPDDAQVLIFDDTRIALAELSHAIYGYPSQRIKVIGITGTKGKTTTAQLIYHTLNDNHIKTGYIGTNGVLYGSVSQKTANTTPESSELARILSDMVKDGVKYAVLEVSSQALYLNRVRGIEFDSLIYTNLYPDHIGGAEHPTFDHYRDSKRKLFSDYPTTLVVTNGDDPYSDFMTEGTEGHRVEYTVGGSGWIRAENPSLLRDGSDLGVEFDLCVCDKSLKVRLPMPGVFNIHNALAATTVCIKAGVRIEKIARSFESVKLDGRFQVVRTGLDATFVIDYAHNGASLESVLSVLREYEPKRLVCLFGSVGGRTKTRRAELAAAASKYCDLCILTSDNPDFEDPNEIIDEIASHMGDCPCLKIADRREAIEKAASMSQKGDIFLLAGKGHEDYQLINGEKIPFSEREILLDCGNKLGAV